MLTFLKLGGSLITDKTREATFLGERMDGLAQAIQSVLAARPDLRLLIGHGSGSFGHFAARKHGTAAGVQTEAQWLGFAEVGRVARSLTELVSRSLAEAGVAVWPVQPSASAECVDGRIAVMDTRPLEAALAHGLVPLVHGDVALDRTRGGTIISTETIFFYLAPILLPRRIVLLGEVDGVLDAWGNVIPQITPGTYSSIESALGGSHGVDVTGGMASKVRDMLRLVEAVPGLTVRIVSGLDPALVQRVLSDPALEAGTAIGLD